jgi:hypothetical protein
MRVISGFIRKERETWYGAYALCHHLLPSIMLFMMQQEGPHPMLATSC